MLATVGPAAGLLEVRRRHDGVTCPCACLPISTRAHPLRFILLWKRNVQTPPAPVALALRPVRSPLADLDLRSATRFDTTSSWGTARDPHGERGSQDVVMPALRAPDLKRRPTYGLVELGSGGTLAAPGLSAYHVAPKLLTPWP